LVRSVTEKLAPYHPTAMAAAYGVEHLRKGKDVLCL